MREIQRGEIYLADLGEGIGSEQKGVRPVLVVQNNRGKKRLIKAKSIIINSVNRIAGTGNIFEV